ncbi:response regulator transcription factor [Desulfovibrio inopinatus]|uniref:response regulator transcription factor n=1 Tax=Desulfovibrio inopinatus TaxID=102109 RepID=UPI0004178090|nr:response regulator [Desulfovibrio inopinatus]
MKTIFIVDDDRLVRDSLRRGLSVYGYNVQTFEKGSQALRMLAIQPAHLLISDVFMPDMDGLEVLLAAKKQQVDLKLVVVSGGAVRSPLSRDDALTLARTLGADAVMKKPVALDELVTNVRSLIGD